MIKELKMKNKQDKKELDELLRKLIESRHLIPVIGSGFSAGAITRNGTVPDMKQLQKTLIELLIKTDTYKDETKESFYKLDLFQISDAFWREMDKEENKHTLRKFNCYMEENFTKVRDLEQSKRRFLASGWKYIYTLNYDDAIETVIDIEKIVPFTRQSKQFIEEHDCLFKIHGDAGMFARTGDKRYCLLSKKQYLESIKADENFDMCKHLEADFAASHILYVGCGLYDELDLLFASETGFSQKAYLDKDKAPSVYIYYKPEGELPDKLELADKIKLEQYGISYAILVEGEREINELYDWINEIYIDSQKVKKSSEIEKYRGLRFGQLSEEDEENYKYFFLRDSVSIKNDKIVLPGFWSARKIDPEVDLANKEKIHIVSGNKMSGKTYFLLQLVKSSAPESTYYFPEGLNLKTEVLDALLEKCNITLVIDTGVLTIQQIQIILEKYEALKKKSIQVVLALNTNDKEFVEFYIKNKGDLNGKILFHNLSNKFKDEAEEFNRHIAKLRLINYDKKDTIIDFLLKTEQQILDKTFPRIIPSVNVIKNNDIQMIKAIIVLAIENTISINKAMELDIYEALLKLNENYSITVERDYLSELEENSSRYKFVNNSPYWIMKILVNYAKSARNHVSIAKAFEDIILRYRHIYRTNFSILNRKMKEYYFLDTLQLLFSNNESHGTLQLPLKIYERLHSILDDNYQFLHQEAKCELRVARREKKNEEFLKILKKAYLNIGRALDLGKKAHAGNIEYTLKHMKVTKALILSNYAIREKVLDRLEETIEVYHEVFIEEKELLSQEFLKRDDLNDVEEFLNFVIMSGDEIVLSDTSKNYFAEIYYYRTNKYLNL